MRAAPEIRTQPLADTALPCSRVWLNGQACAATLPGAILEAALAWSGGFVVLLSDGDSFEDNLHIHLLSPSGQWRDTAFFGGHFTSGTFDHLHIIGPQQFGFVFFAGVCHHITLFDRPRLRCLFPETTGFHRPRGLWRHFGVRRQRRCCFPPLAQPSP